MAEKAKTVLLLGAGASAGSAFRLPTMRGFFLEDVAEIEGLDQFLQWFYPNVERAAYNLEDVLSYLDLSQARTAAWGHEPDERSHTEPSVMFERMVEYVRRRLTIPDKAVCPAHVELFRRLELNDSILTLNYDLVADHALLRHRSPNEGTTRLGKVTNLIGERTILGESLPCLTPQDEASGFYLKLHGSLDWTRCPTVGCVNHTNIHHEGGSRAENPDGEPERSSGRLCRFCGATLQTYILPPVALKHIEEKGRTGFLWRLALRELAKADRIVIIGLSFAPTDFQLRWLVRRAVEIRGRAPDELTVVNPSREIWTTVLEVFPGYKGEHIAFESMEAYLQHIAGETEPRGSDRLHETTRRARWGANMSRLDARTIAGMKSHAARQMYFSPLTDIAALPSCPQPGDTAHLLSTLQRSCARSDSLSSAS